MRQRSCKTTATELSQDRITSQLIKTDFESYWWQPSQSVPWARMKRIAIAYSF